MKFHDYVNQDTPKRQGKGSVRVNRNEIEWSRFNPEGEVITLDIWGELHNYLLPYDSNEGLLYCMDEDENKSTLSVFKLINYIIHDDEIKEGDFAINTDDENAEPRKVSKFSETNDTLGFHQRESWFQWMPLGKRHKRVFFTHSYDGST